MTAKRYIMALRYYPLPLPLTIDTGALSRMTIGQKRWRKLKTMTMMKQMTTMHQQQSVET